MYLADPMSVNLMARHKLLPRHQILLQETSLVSIIAFHSIY